jgi:cell wall-associated NlpC family hydrolase
VATVDQTITNKLSEVNISLEKINNTIDKKLQKIRNVIGKIIETKNKIEYYISGGFMNDPRIKLMVDKLVVKLDKYVKTANMLISRLKLFITSIFQKITEKLQALKDWIVEQVTNIITGKAKFIQKITQRIKDKKSFATSAAEVLKNVEELSKNVTSIDTSFIIDTQNSLSDIYADMPNISDAYSTGMMISLDEIDARQAAYYNQIAKEQERFAEEYRKKDEEYRARLAEQEQILRSRTQTQQAEQIQNNYISNTTTDTTGEVIPPSGDLASGTSSKTTKYDQFFKKYCGIADIPWQLMQAMSFQESSWDPKAYNKSGCVGLMQLNRKYYSAWKVTRATEFDPEVNIRGGAYAIKGNLAHPQMKEVTNWGEKMKFMLCAYNAGIKYSKNAINKLKSKGLALTWTNALKYCTIPAETRQYVPNIIGFYNSWANRPSIASEPAVATFSRNKPNNNSNEIANSNSRATKAATNTPTTGGVTKSKAQAIVDAAYRILNSGKVRYVLGAKINKNVDAAVSGGYTDCSGFTQYLYKRYAGVDIGGNTLYQIHAGKTVSKQEARPGDVILFQNTNPKHRGPGQPSHAGLIVDSTYMIHNSNPKRNINKAKWSDGYWNSPTRFLSIRRILADDEMTVVPNEGSISGTTSGGTTSGGGYSYSSRSNAGYVPHQAKHYSGGGKPGDRFVCNFNHRAGNTLANQTYFRKIRNPYGKEEYDLVCKSGIHRTGAINTALTYGCNPYLALAVDFYLRPVINTEECEMDTTGLMREGVEWIQDMISRNVIGSPNALISLSHYGGETYSWKHAYKILTEKFKVQPRVAAIMIGHFIMEGGLQPKVVNKWEKEGKGKSGTSGWDCGEGLIGFTTMDLKLRFAPKFNYDNRRINNETLATDKDTYILTGPRISQLSYENSILATIIYYESMCAANVMERTKDKQYHFNELSAMFYIGKAGNGNLNNKNYNRFGHAQYAGWVNQAYYIGRYIYNASHCQEEWDNDPAKIAQYSKCGYLVALYLAYHVCKIMGIDPNEVDGKAANPL